MNDPETACNPVLSGLPCSCGLKKVEPTYDKVATCTKSLVFEATPDLFDECFHWEQVTYGSLGAVPPLLYPQEMLERMGCKQGKRYRFRISIEEIE